MALVFGSYLMFGFWCLVFNVMSPDKLILFYTTATLGAVCAASIYSEFRKRRFEPTQSADHIFRCKKCAFVYTDDPDVALSRCPQCGGMNEAIEF